MRVAILGSPSGFYVRDLQRAAEEYSFDDRGIESIDCLAFSELRVSTPNEVLILNDSTLNESRCESGSGLGLGLLAQYDAMLVRSMPLGSLEQVIFRMNALHVATKRGKTVLNHPRTLEIAIDKWLTLDLASQAGIEVPRTCCCQTRDQAMEAFDQLGHDVVVKPLFGGEGRGLIRVTDIDMAHRVFSTLEQIQAVSYLQKFLPHHGHDLRILFIGDEWFSIARQSQNNDWRTNLSRGAKAIVQTATERQLDIARRAKEAVDGDMIGVDILPTLDGRDVLLEVNAVPGWKGVAAAYNIDIAERVLEYVISKTNRCLQHDS